MGVLACDRDGCSNIMCDVCIDGKWYICWDCEQDFIAFVESKQFESDKELTEERLLKLMKKFMNSRKSNKTPVDLGIINQFLNKYRK